MIVGPYHPGPWNPPPLEWHDAESFSYSHVSVLDAPFGVRAWGVMRRLGVNTLGELCAHTKDQLIASKNCGRTTIEKIELVLDAYGLKLSACSNPQITMKLRHKEPACL